MKIEFVKDPSLEGMKICVMSAERDGKAEETLGQLERLYCDTVHAYRDASVFRFSQSDILRVYAEDNRVFCQVGHERYLLHARLYEMEELLDPELFVRISKWEIVNKHKILRLDVSLSGSIGVALEGDVKTHTSRRYMQKIKAAFGI